MSCGQAVVEDDTEEYLELCQHLNVKPETDSFGARPYCQHARDLRKRYDEEKAKKQGDNHDAR